jgi:hypothetical protein
MWNFTGALAAALLTVAGLPERVPLIRNSRA